MAATPPATPPRVALCLTGALKMNPDAAPLVAKHILSHTARPWNADVFVVVEISNTLVESHALRDYAGNVNAVDTQVLCAKPGCHDSVSTWCLAPTCTNRSADVAHHMFSSRQRHCGQLIKQTPTFQFQSLKRQACYGAILQREQKLGQRFDYIAYQRPELWTPRARAMDELAILERLPGIWVDRGRCQVECTAEVCGVTTKAKPNASSTSSSVAPSIPPARVTPRSDCEKVERLKAEMKTKAAKLSQERNQSEKVVIASLPETREISKIVSNECGVASDQAAVVPRRYADDYFSAADLVGHIASNRTFGCTEFYGGSSGICACGGTPWGSYPSQECMLTAWLRHRDVPWSNVPWDSAWALGLAEGGKVAITGMTGERAPRARGVPFPPPHCEVDPKGYKAATGLSKLGVHVQSTSKMHHGALYRFSSSVGGRPVLKCDPSSPLW